MLITWFGQKRYYKGSLYLVPVYILERRHTSVSEEKNFITDENMRKPQLTLLKDDDWFWHSDLCK